MGEGAEGSSDLSQQRRQRPRTPPPLGGISVSQVGVSRGVGTLWNQKSHQLGLGNTASMSLFCCFFFVFPEKSLVLNGKISYYSSVKVRQ